MKVRYTLLVLLPLLLLLGDTGCKKKTEKEQYIEASGKLLELYKSEDFWKLQPAEQQTKMQDIVKSSGLEIGTTMEEQTSAFKAISAKYKDDPEVQRLNTEMKKAVMEHMMKSGQMTPPQPQQPAVGQEGQQQTPPASPHGTPGALSSPHGH